MLLLRGTRDTIGVFDTGDAETKLSSLPIRSEIHKRLYYRRDNYSVTSFSPMLLVA